MPSLQNAHRCIPIGTEFVLGSPTILVFTRSKTIIHDDQRPDGLGLQYRYVLKHLPEASRLKTVYPAMMKYGAHLDEPCFHIT